MLVRALQLRQLAQLSRRRFLARLAQHVRQRFPGKTSALPAVALEERLRASIDQAASYGIRIEDDVRRFAEYQVMFGWDFPTTAAHEPMHRILRRAGLAGTDKMNELDDYVTFSRRA